MRMYYPMMRGGSVQIIDISDPANLRGVGAISDNPTIRLG